MKPIEDLAASDFKPLIGQDFDVSGQTLKLVEVEERDPPHPKFRAPFSLIFDGPENMVVQECHPVSHDAIGEHTLLIHRIQVPEGAKFQIIFG